MLPMLKLASDEQAWSLSDAREEIAEHFQLTGKSWRSCFPVVVRRALRIESHGQRFTLRELAYWLLRSGRTFRLPSAEGRPFKTLQKKYPSSSSVSIQSFRSLGIAHRKAPKTRQTTIVPITLKIYDSSPGHPQT